MHKIVTNPQHRITSNEIVNSKQISSLFRNSTIRKWRFMSSYTWPNDHRHLWSRSRPQILVPDNGIATTIKKKTKHASRSTPTTFNLTRSLTFAPLASSFKLSLFFSYCLLDSSVTSYYNYSITPDEFATHQAHIVNSVRLSSPWRAMEPLLSLSFSNISSRDSLKIRKGLRQIEGLLAQICLSTKLSQKGHNRRASVVEGAPRPCKKLEDLGADPAFLEFYRLQDGFEWNGRLMIFISQREGC